MGSQRIRHNRATSLSLSNGKESPCNPGDPGSIPGSGRSPSEGNATHSSIPAWRIPWTEEPGRLQSTGSQGVRHDWVTNTTIEIWTKTWVHEEAGDLSSYSNVVSRLQITFLGLTNSSGLLLIVLQEHIHFLCAGFYYQRGLQAQAKHNTTITIH